MPSSVRKMAICRPWARAATPMPGMSSSIRHIGCQVVGVAGVVAGRLEACAVFIFSSGFYGVGGQDGGPLLFCGRPGLIAFHDMDNVFVGAVVIDRRSEAQQRFFIL